MSDYITELQAWANARVKEHAKQNSALLERTKRNEVLAKHKSKSDPGVVYIVQRIGSSIICNCPGYVFRKRCRHVTEEKQKMVA